MHAKRPHDIVLPCAKLQAVTRLSQNRNTQKIIYMMHDGWHSHYLPYLSSGQQAVTGSLAVSLGSQALQSPSRQRFADFTCAQHDGKIAFVHFITAFSYLPSRQTSIAMQRAKKWARGLHSLRLASRLNVSSLQRMRRAGNAGPSFVWLPLAMPLCLGKTGKHDSVHISRGTMSGMRIWTFRFGVWRISANNHTLLHLLLDMLHGR